MVSNNELSVWDYTQVSVEDIQEVSELGLVFENVEVMSFDMKAVKHLAFGDFDKIYHLSKNTDFKLKPNDMFNHVHIVLDKTVLGNNFDNTEYIHLDEMFGDSPEESREYLIQHFKYPDIVSVALFDNITQSKATFFVSWSNEDPYLNTDITIIDSDDTIQITIKKPDDK